MAGDGAAAGTGPTARPGRGGTYTGYTAGTMTLLTGKLLRFVVTDPQAVGDETSVDFAPLRTEAPYPPACA